MKGLHEWIAECESSETSNLFQREILLQLREDLPDCDSRTKSDNLAVRDSVSYALKALWIDLNLWRLVRDGEEPASIQSAIKRHHGLQMPPFSHQVWQEMVRDPSSRRRMFALLRSKPSVLIGASMSVEAKEAYEELQSKGASNLILRYLGRDAVSRRSHLSRLTLSAGTLKAIRQALINFNKDVEWCLANPSVTKPTPILFPARGTPMTSERIGRIERMVEIVKRIPMATIGKVADEFAVKTATVPHNLSERSLREEARHAKLLAELREGVDVKHHLDQTGKFGRKPRRNSSG